MVLAPEQSPIAPKEAVRREAPSERGKQIRAGRRLPWPAAPVHDEEPERVSYVQASELLSARHCLVARLYYFQLNSESCRSRRTSALTLRRPASGSFNSICFPCLGGLCMQGPPICLH